MIFCIPKMNSWSTAALGCAGFSFKIPNRFEVKICQSEINRGPDTNPLESLPPVGDKANFPILQPVHQVQLQAVLNSSFP
jgi:hypothetical protein